MNNFTVSLRAVGLLFRSSHFKYFTCDVKYFRLKKSKNIIGVIPLLANQKHYILYNISK